MITVREHKGKEHSIRVQGHAGAGEPGYDLVCASASALLWTLYANVEQQSDDFTADMRSGDALIAVRDKDLSCFDTIMTGYKWLAQNYPEFIRVGVDYTDDIPR